MTPINELPPPVQQWEGPTKPKHRRLVRDVYKLLKQSIWALVQHEGLELSGYMAFTCILSLFPFLIFLAALAGFIGEADSANQTVNLIFEFMPAAVAKALTPIITEVLTQQHGGLLTFGIVFTLWTASSGIEALRTLLNRSYGVTETRPIWYLRPQSVLMVVVGAIVMTLLSIGIVLGPIISSVVQHFTFVPTANIVIWILLRYAVAAITISVFLMALHLILPNQRQKLRTVWPGSAVTTLLWLGMASLFSLYLDNSSSYSITYGSLGGIIISLMFFYISAIIFAFGAEVNATLKRNFS